MKHASILNGTLGLVARFAIVVAALTGADTAAADMKAGVAKAVITNDEPRVMVNGRVSEGTLDDIHARCLVLNDGEKRLAIITYDLNCLDVATPYLRVRARDELGIPPEYLILLATHNHNAPIQINPDNFDYGEWLADRMFGLIEEAIANEKGPVKLEFGSGHGYFLFSRGNAPVDYEIQVLNVLYDDEPQALLFNHPTHPMQASRSLIDPGHPGYAMDYIEEAIPGVQAMYADAAGGNQFPLRPKGFEQTERDPRGRSMPDEERAKIAKALGRELADDVLDILNDGNFQDVTGPISSKMETFSLPLGAPIPKSEAEELAKKFPEDVGLVHYPHKHRGTNWVRNLLYWYESGLPFPKTTTEMICTDDTYLFHKTEEKMLEKYDYAIHDELPCVYEETIVTKIGPMAFVAMQGEVCAPIGSRIKDTFRRDMPIMVFGYMGEHNLYIPTRELVRLNAYQAKVLQIQYASPVPWDPSVEDEMVNNVVRLVEDVMGVE